MNADGVVSTNQGMIDKNMFAYCENEPNRRSDATGNRWCYDEYAKSGSSKSYTAVDGLQDFG